MISLADIPGAVRFVTPYLALLAAPIVLLLGYQLAVPGRRRALELTGLEYLVARRRVSAGRRRILRAALRAVIGIGLALLWAGPEYYSSEPLFERDLPTGSSRYIVALDISPSMNLPSDLSGYGEDDLLAGEGGVTRYEMARDALSDFIEQFRGEQIGLILFSTEPLLARWPTVETDTRFAEVLESIRRGSATQLSAFSSLTNIDKALLLVKSVASDGGGAVILISDAEDDLENLGGGVRSIRASGLRLYVIGVGISEDVIETLSDDFADDPGFRIFRAASEEEMDEAYRLVGTVETSAVAGSTGKIYRSDVMWIFALFLLIPATALIVIGESNAHVAFPAGRSRPGLGGDPDGV